MCMTLYVIHKLFFVISTKKIVDSIHKAELATDMLIRVIFPYILAINIATRVIAHVLGNLFIYYFFKILT